MTEQEAEAEDIQSDYIQSLRDDNHVEQKEDNNNVNVVSTTEYFAPWNTLNEDDTESQQAIINSKKGS